MNRLFTLLLGCLCLYVSSASALNIVLTNDDGWNTHNIKALKASLVEAGHDVIMSAPCAAQSGKGGAMTLFKALPVDTSRAESNDYCVGDTDGSKSFERYADGTPAMAVLYGIDVLAQQRWGGNPDLVISGPNEGNNLGMRNNNSGTLGAMMIAMDKGVPAVAVSAHHESGKLGDDQQAIADAVVALVARLIETQKEGEPILPPNVGINMNLPEHVVEHRGFLATQVGYGSGMSLQFAEDMSENPAAMYLVASGILASGRVETMEQAMGAATKVFAGQSGAVMDLDAESIEPGTEAAAVRDGYIAISVINGNIQAGKKATKKMNKRLGDLLD